MENIMGYHGSILDVDLSNRTIGKMKLSQDDDLLIISSEVLPNFSSRHWQPFKNGTIIKIEHTTYQPKIDISTLL